MNETPFWNLWARYRSWVREHRVQAQIAAITAFGIGLIIVMFVVTIIIIFRTLR